MQQHKLGGLEMPQAWICIATYPVQPWDPDWTRSSDVPPAALSSGQT